MTGKVIFIGGVHGVGKGTLASQVSEATGIRCFSASDLIKERKKAPVDHEKNVIDADQNQEFLVSAVLDKVMIHELLILDGHFTLWQENEILPIPETVFMDLPIEGIVLVSEPSETVTLRLAERDGKIRSVTRIAEAVKTEEGMARQIQKKLDVPMLTVSSSQSLRVSEWIRQQVRRLQ